ncbi:DUF1206 domain-containing protein [Hymenobacter crusticola]|uniref:DUF1206 domain-containing protein n=1 Tax=Hymenobacter crusticola TaxID=1770526 RepID=A0A243WLB0_9BACT|nr:DUF1206 domain-containing protein [Hymenobacter crusticola]OUJ75931.1 hypothetical protein BXP70_01190 [Hymenobacter crusticola]
MALSVSPALPSPSEGIRTLARFGFAAKGIVYFLLGGLALLAATGMKGGQTADKEKAVLTLQELPMGRWLLGLVALGLFGYVIWRFVQAVRDTEHKGTKPMGLAKRLGYAGSGALYAALALYAGRAAVQGAPPSSSGNGRQTLVAKVLEFPLGEWLVGAAALLTIGIGLYQIYRAYAGKFKKDVDSSSLSSEQKQLVERTGQAGYTARGIVLGILGYFLLQAALNSNSQEVQGTEGAFDLLSSMGPAVLGIVALGLMAYGVYQIVRARFPMLQV